ncbi:hypothetical protein EW145_g2235 [Phellinidium pouzarii]|uniref:Uncharacterized protein n=1 Tax=Phellinidium pouzarii TaxID=167371 RepID=A0A4S4LC61_9AGAM|nr:hypothetical protein EW145_g2235 [Phellinidium pouzarii]
MRLACEWEDDLLGIVPTQSTQPPQSAQPSSASTATPLPSTLTTKARQHLATPQSSPVKRVHSQMMNPVTPMSQPQNQSPRGLSPEARARRLASIMDALKQSVDPEVDTTTSSVQTERIPASDGEDEEDGRRSNLNEGFDDPMGESSDDEGRTPASKRSRVTVKTEEEEPPRTPRRDSSFPLPTPFQTSQRARPRSDSLLDFEDGPASPTSFTLGAQRAARKANDIGSSASNDTKKGKQRARSPASSASRGVRDFREASAEMKDIGDEDEDAPVRFSFLRSFFRFLTAYVTAQTEHGDNSDGLEGPPRPESYQAQLASIYSQSAHNLASTTGQSQRATPPLQSATVLKSIQMSMKAMVEAETAVQAMQNEVENLKQSLAAAEKNALAQSRRIHELEQDKVQLERFRNSFENLTQMTPPARK